MDQLVDFRTMSAFIFSDDISLWLFKWHKLVAFWMLSVCGFSDSVILFFRMTSACRFYDGIVFFRMATCCGFSDGLGLWLSG
jgi:hypothetical protein